MKRNLEACLTNPLELPNLLKKPRLEADATIMMIRLLSVWLAFVFAVPGAVLAQAAAVQQLRGHVPPQALGAAPLGRMAPQDSLRISIALPLRNREALSNQIAGLYDPSSPEFGRYLSTKTFTEAYGPSQQDYDATLAYARSNGFTIAGTHPNRMMVELEAPVAAIEKAFGVRMNQYKHPKEDRLYYAPDAEPSLRLGTPVLHISGLNNYTLPRPNLRLKEMNAPDAAAPMTGSGTSGSFMGYDFRKAYLPGVTLTGTGQSVGLFQLDGYFASAISNYVKIAGLPNVALKNVLVGGFNGSPGTGEMEVCLDIEMVLSMAPGISNIIVYEGLDADPVLNRMATDNAARQLSCSWSFEVDTATEQIFLQFAAQGQSFFQASGDNGAYSDAVMSPTDTPWVTVVGGTELATTSSGAWLSETVWNGSSGGISTAFPIPSWQAGVATEANQGSATMRNLPDVAMIAYDVFVSHYYGLSDIGAGTSVAAPLWAGLAALVNQRGASLGKPSLGFANPAIYRAARAGQTSFFHDIVSGNNFTTNSPDRYQAAPGYDLCSGWGSPVGTNLFDALLASPSEPLVIASFADFWAAGPVGGPFTLSSQSCVLSNAGTSALSWSLSGLPSWLAASSTNGQIAARSSSTVTFSLNQGGTNLLLGAYSATVTFSNANTSVSQTRDFKVLAGNPGFETGDFTFWTFSGQSANNGALGNDNDQYPSSSSVITGLSDSAFTHSGLYGAFLGQNTSLGYLSQYLPTSAGKPYLLSIWFCNPLVGTPNEFQVMWNGTNVCDYPNLGAMDWTNFQFVVAGTGTSSQLMFGFRNDDNAFGLDDISFQILPSPSIAAGQDASHAIQLSWTAYQGASYQPQYRTNLSTGSWINLGSPVAGTGSTVSITNAPGAAPRYYRVVVP